MAGKKGKRKSSDSGGVSRPRRGIRRSIRYDAVDSQDDGRSDGRSDGRGEPRPTETINLRHLILDEALDRLEIQLRLWRQHGRREVLVIHGKGQNSPSGISVLGPAVRSWCQEHGELVAGWQEAPAAWGGAGAIIVTLR